MRRPVNDSAEMPGQDSFLDVIANMVGIVIILVMVVGVRAGQMPASSEAPVEAPSPEKQLAPLQVQSRAVEGDVHRLHEESEVLKATIAGRAAERDKLALLAAAMDDELNQRRAALDEAGRADFDLRREFAATRQQLEELQRQRETIAAIPAKQVRVQSLPTPISKTVHGNELHMQIRGGRVTPIPLDELLETFQETARHKVWKLEDQQAMIDTIGPIGGFRMRYELGRFEIPADMTRQNGRGGTIIRLVKWELLPVALDLGESPDDALADGSAFRSFLVGKDPTRTTITLWTYPDSFDAFRRLKAYLHGQGYAAAGRPLPEDQPIGGSPEGSRSSAQ